MTAHAIAYPIRYPIGSHRVDPNRGRIPRPVPSRPVPFNLQDQSCNLTVGARRRSADRPVPVRVTLLGLELIA